MANKYLQKYSLHNLASKIYALLQLAHQPATPLLTANATEPKTIMSLWLGTGDAPLPMDPVERREYLLKGEVFLSWLVTRLNNQVLSVNHSTAAVHIVDQGVFLLAPRIFRLYLHLHQLDECLHRKLSKNFSRLQIHKRKGDINLHQYHLKRAPHKVLNGWLIPFKEIYAPDIPAINPYLVRTSSGDSE
ncbi:hypothetical protein D0C16_08405 [Cellvibrio sp. KY-GH-1]|uniref:conjugal transfer nickase/helicase domain-containing protein n=1 Tax=Cellvibrio sp. KY-GH-1 TaxID=2303332 RepID=UPI0012460306|nr:DNA-binding domain-containing protein [Cellvibrio sp. KY-GH-1]QEY15995.1 hypothetical protein D0C16_08405 [Cellvibrio sp. KY-GH-1]